MKVLLINGSPRENGETYRALSVIEKVLRDYGVESKYFQLGMDAVRGCIHCGGRYLLALGCKRYA